MLTKRCIDCGIIFTTDDPDKERCDLCEDDRREEDEADNDYVRNVHRIRRHRRRYLNTEKGLLKLVYGLLLNIMERVNKHIGTSEHADVSLVTVFTMEVQINNAITLEDLNNYDSSYKQIELMTAVKDDLWDCLLGDFGAESVRFVHEEMYLDEGGTNG